MLNPLLLCHEVTAAALHPCNLFCGIAVLGGSSLISFINFWAMIQGKSSEQLLHSETLQNNQGFMEDMTRLGSIPPSCRNKCNACNPCKAIQVPTLPNHDQVHKISRRSSPTEASKKYTNYKPIGWKCKCGNRLFNP